MIEEEAKATQEIAKATGKGIDAIKKFFGFMKDIFGAPLIEYGDALHDKIKLYRYKNLLNIIDAVTEIHSKRRLAGKVIPIPPRYAIPIMEKASLEENKNLQEMWAGLIANASDPNQRLQINKLYVEILSAIEPLDAVLLEFLSKQGINVGKGLPSEGLNLARLSKELNATEKEVRLSIYNLIRLQCLVAEKKLTWDNLDGVKGGLILDNEMSFRVSFLGYSLLKACSASKEENQTGV